MGRFLLFLTAAAMLSSCSTDKYTAEILSADSVPESHVSAPSGRTRSYGEALEIARRSIGIVDGTEVTRAGKARTIRDGRCVTRQSTRNDGIEQTDTLVYVFNFNDNAGFSIIAANILSEPIIAVTENGNYSYGEPTGNKAFDSYINTAIAQSKNPKLGWGKIDTLRTYPVEYTVLIDEHNDCEPLISVNWGQKGELHNIYGKYCPNNISGCVATAMAQIMTYHKRPKSITTTYDNAPHAKETINLDWDSMINYIDWDIATYCEHISILMREIGERVHMDYSNPTYSSAYDSYVIPSFKSFGYVWSANASSFRNSQVYSSLDNKCPVYISGKKRNDINFGHAWVADGYKSYRHGTETYVHKSIYPDAPLNSPDYILVSTTVEETQLLHYNWGFEGKCNGYFQAINTCDMEKDVVGFDENDTYADPTLYDTFINLQIITNIK